MRPLSEIIEELLKKDVEAFRVSKDKDSNIYYEAKKERISQGNEEILLFDDDEEPAYKSCNGCGIYCDDGGSRNGHFYCMDCLDNKKQGRKGNDN